MKIALVGNQNSGKTTLFNLLTGSNQKIGNWPGVTLERKSGFIKGASAELVDLPGIYSLSPYTAEEEVSRHFIFEEKLDLIINIIDATSIERSLYLTTQLLELDTPLVIALNMTDIMAKKGVDIDVDALAKALSVDIISISALRKTGINDLITYIQQFQKHKSTPKEIFPRDIEQAIAAIEVKLEIPHKRFVAIKLLEKDQLCPYQINGTLNRHIEALENKYTVDVEELIAHQRYEYIVSVIKQIVHIKDNGQSMTDQLDRIFLHKWLALPIFAIIMFLVYFLSVGVVGGLTVDLTEGVVENFGEWLRTTLTTLNASEWSSSLVVDGILAGIGAVLAFVPQLVILFLCISLLETTGYMSRIAFFFDRIFKRLGLSGKALIPFIVGSGCSVPGVMATKTIDNDNERRLTVILTPFIPCSAKLPIIALFAGFFFDRFAGLVSVSLYFFSIVVIVLSALLLKALLKGKVSAFVFELPDYKLPSLRYVSRDVFGKAWEFIKRAGTIIFLCSVVVWFLLSFSWSFIYGIPVDQSILASIGRVFSWIFFPILGELSWEATVSAIQGLVAKEQVVSSMAIIAGFGENGTSNVIFNSSAFGFFTGLSAYAFMVFNLFAAPCFGAIAAMRKELGSTKRVLLAVLFQTGLAWVLASLVFGVGSLIGMVIS